jgi:hypothetical protein
MSASDLDVTAGSWGGFSTVVVDDLIDANKGYAVGPERALLSALLFDGIQAFIAYALAATAAERNAYAEAHRWVMDRGTEYAFAFNNVCEGLGIHPDYLRFGLVNASNSLLAEVGKSRRSSQGS